MSRGERSTRDETISTKQPVNRVDGRTDRKGASTALLVRRSARPYLFRIMMKRALRFAPLLLLTFGVAGCDTGTSRISAEQERQFQAEGIRRKEDDVIFRFTRDAGGRSERWEDRKASIIVTGSSVLIHKNEKIGLEITPRTKRDVSVQRSGGRIRIRTGRGRSEEIWSFQPQTDAEGWVADIRATMKGSRAVNSR